MTNEQTLPPAVISRLRALQTEVNLAARRLQDALVLAAEYHGFDASDPNVAVDMDRGVIGLNLTPEPELDRAELPEAPEPNGEVVGAGA